MNEVAMNEVALFQQKLSAMSAYQQALYAATLQPTTLASLRKEYVNGTISLEEFERRIEPLLKARSGSAS